MLKTLMVAGLLAALTLFLAGCGGKADIPAGIYRMEAQAQPSASATIQIDGDGGFVFTYSALSSYLPQGRCRWQGKRLLLPTEDGRYTFAFDITEESLLFCREKSVSLPEDFARYVADGALFVLEK